MMENNQENTPRIDPEIHESWKALLLEEFNQPYFITLKQYLVQEKNKHVIYPPGNRIFSAFNRTSFDQVKVVILGQDPYHGKGQAHGLCFSVPPFHPTATWKHGRTRGFSC